MREYLERDVMTATEGRVAFHARVAVNVLGMVERELELGAAQDAEEHARLVALLGREGTVRELTESLARGIRDGSLDVPLVRPGRGRPRYRPGQARGGQPPLPELSRSANSIRRHEEKAGCARCGSRRGTSTR